jgi:enoyl-CoA hydratase/carnithine racemase
MAMSPFAGSQPLTKSWQHFDFDLTDGIATVTFQRPAKKNALTFEAYADLRDLLPELSKRDDVGALVIGGEGQGFCSGGDVEEIIGALAEMDTREKLEFTRMTCAVCQRMRECPLPIIASVNGVAAGAGSVIALAADLRILAESASFVFLFTKVGLAGADMGSAYLLPRIVGLGRATELLLLGDRVDSARARDMGLATAVAADTELSDTVSKLARRLSDGPGLAYANTKMCLSRELDMDLAGALELDAMTQALLMTSNDHSEFLASFRQDRSPVWEGR